MPELERSWCGVELFSSPPQLLHNVWKINKAKKLGFGDVISLYHLKAAQRETVASAVLIASKFAPGMELKNN